MKRSHFLTVIFIFVFSFSYSQNWDIDLLKKINIDRNTHLDGFFKLMTNSAGPIAYGSPLIITTSGILTKDRDLTVKGIVCGASVVSAVLVTTSIKYIVNRQRPYKTYPELQPLASEGSPSFPSGHTTDAFATATYLSLNFPKWYVIVPAYTWAGLVGYSRMHLGVHYPSDVLGGAIVGAGCAFLTFKANQWLNKKYHYANKQKIFDQAKNIQFQIRF